MLFLRGPQTNNNTHVTHVMLVWASKSHIKEFMLFPRVSKTNVSTGQYSLEDMSGPFLRLERNDCLAHVLSLESLKFRVLHLVYDVLLCLQISQSDLSCCVLLSVEKRKRRLSLGSFLRRKGNSSSELMSILTHLELSLNTNYVGAICVSGG
jgi:hypothetical protein